MCMPSDSCFVFSATCCYQGLIETGHATHSTAKQCVTIYSNTKLKEILKFSVYFPSKFKVQVLVLLFLVTLFILPSIIGLWELHALSL